MKKIAKKVISVILAITIALTTVLATVAASNECPLDIEITTNKDEYGTLGKAKFVVEVTNKSNATVENVSAEAVFDELDPFGFGSKISAEDSALEPGETLRFEFKATLDAETMELNFIQKILLKILRCFHGDICGFADEDFDDGRAMTSKTHKVTFGKYEVEQLVEVWYEGESNETYAVTFDLNYDGAPENPETQVVKHGEKANEPVVERENYLLIGWYLEDVGYTEVFDFNQNINKDIKLYARWFDINDTKDSDNDGLSDSLEEQFGSDPSNKDTDNDGVDDYNELNWLNSNPSSNDTNKDGKNDGIEDEDGDGLKNAEEVSLGTHIAYWDTDYDQISDYDEINVYNTSPLLDDTDEDGVKDGIEVQNNSNPLVAEENFVTEMICGEVSELNSVAAKATVVTDDEGAGTLDVKEVTFSDNALITTSIPGYLGSAFDFTTDGEFKSATLEFTYDTSLGTIGDDFQPRIYYVNETTGEFEEVPGQIVEDGKVTVVVSHFSTYILLNKVNFEAVWDKDIKPVDYEGDGKTGIDIVFVIDSSGSMSSNDGSKIRHQAAKQFVDKLGENDRAAVVSFAGSASVYQDFTNDHDLLYTAIDKVGSNGSSTNLSSGIGKAINLFTNSNYTRTDAYKYVVFLTDGNGSYSSSYTTSAYDNGLVIYTVGLGSGVKESVLRGIAEGTGGKYYFASSATQLPDIYSDVSFETVDYVTDSNGDGISDYYTNLINDGKLLISSGSYALVGVCDLYGFDCKDWDGDGLLNGEEIKAVTTNYGTYIKMMSNPVVNDTDGDGFDDYAEVKTNKTDPLKFTEYGGEDVKTLMDSDGFTYTMYMDDKNAAKFIAAVFGWQKEEKSKQTYINYFYDYASESSISDNAEKIEKLAKREKAWEIVESVASFVQLSKSVVDLGTDLGSYDSTVKAQRTKYNNNHKASLQLYNKGDYDKIFEEYGNIDDYNKDFDVLKNAYNYCQNGAPIEKINFAVSTISSVTKIVPALKKVKLPLGKTINKFSQKYQTWLGSRPGGNVTCGSIISIVSDGVNLVTDVANLTNIYGKLQANSQAFVEYIELIEYISKDSENSDYVKMAAGDVVKIVLDESNKEYYKQLYTIIGVQTAGAAINAAITVLGDVFPYVKVAKTILDIVEATLTLTGLTAFAQSFIKSECIHAISEGCNYYLQEILVIDGDWYSYDSGEKERVNLYLIQLAQSRIVGEDSICTYLKEGNLINWLAKLFFGSSNDELESNYSTIISYIYIVSEDLGLNLSKNLPRYPSDYMD